MQEHCTKAKGKILGILSASKKAGSQNYKSVSD